MADGTTRARRPRSDSQHNRSEILEVAERHFSEDGVSSSLEAVARDAGVGSATLYRHFPTRDALLAELLQRRESELEDARARIAEIADSGLALRAWMSALEDFFGVFDGLPGPLRSAYLEEHNPLATTCVGFIELTDEYLSAAQRDGKAHDWVSGSDLFLAALALTWVRGSSLAEESSHQRLQALISGGYATDQGRGTS